MQTLNVGAGQSDVDYKAAEQERRADLRADSLSSANLFFWAAGLSALGTGVLPVKLNIIVSIGAIDLLAFYGKSLGGFYPLALYGAAAMWLLALLALGFAARRPSLGILGRHHFVRFGHANPYDHVFIVGVRCTCFLRIQVVPRTTSAERSAVNGRLAKGV